VLIAHLSDLHVFSPSSVRLAPLLNRRLLGSVKMLLSRAREYPRDVAEALFEDVDRVAPDHVIVSGDVSNLSLRGEFRRVRQMLSALSLASGAITVVPGNHDYYSRWAQRRDEFGSSLGPYLKGDSAPWQGFPFLRVRDGVAIVALNSGRPSGPGFATGALGTEQLAAAEVLLNKPEARCRFRIVALHHAPGVPRTLRHLRKELWHKRLTDGAALIEMIGRVGADLVLHGHLHRECRDELRGPAGRALVLGAGSSTWIGRDAALRASYRLYEIGPKRELVRITTRRYDTARRVFSDATEG
jgi:3',5'-cyclic AMP phosphodiesterase CpdA